jgi:hypothetical protein
MKTFRETLKQMLDALAFADASEYLTSREKTRILARSSRTILKTSQITGAGKADTGRNTSRVALYLGCELPAHVMSYVMGTCARLGHDLLVLTFESKNTARALLEPYQTSLRKSGVDMKLVTLSGGSVNELNRYLRSHSDVAFLVCKDSGYLGRGYLSGRQRENAVPVPVVIIANPNEISSQPVQPAAEHNSRLSEVA